MSHNHFGAESIGGTMTQPDLFDPPPRQKHSQTSSAAAVEIQPRAGTLRDSVLHFIRGRMDLGATDEEIQRVLEMDPSTQRPRRIELVKAGLVTNSGGTRTTTSGRQAVVWIVT